MTFLASWDKHFLGTNVIALALASTSVSVCVNKNFNLGHNFQTRSDKAFILHMCIPCDKTFHMVPLFWSLWHWPWSLTYFWKILTLTITLKPEEVWLSYCTSVFLVTRLFTWYQILYLMTLTLNVDLLLKSFNLGWYLVMVTAWLVLLFSNNLFNIYPFHVTSTFHWYHNSLPTNVLTLIVVWPIFILSSDDDCYFYAPGVKGPLGHLVIGWSVHPSVCLFVHLSIYL